MTALRKLWWGAYSLPKTFWGAYVLGGLFFIVLLRPTILLMSYHFHVGTIGFIVATVLVYAYISIATIGVWRSAEANLASPIWMVRFWAIAARGLVALWAAGFLWWLYNGGLQTLMQRMTAPIDF